MHGPRKNMTDDERHRAYNEYQNNYGKKTWKCDVCNIEMKYFSRTKHLKTKKHRGNDFKQLKCDTCNIKIYEVDHKNIKQVNEHKPECVNFKKLIL